MLYFFCAHKSQYKLRYQLAESSLEAKNITNSILHDSKKSKWENVYLKCKITLYTMYLPEFKTIHYVILFIFS